MAFSRSIVAPGATALGFVVAVAAAGCVEDVGGEGATTLQSPRGRSIASPLDVARVPAPLAAGHCDINVVGTGIVDLEGEYLPNVVFCENGGANLEALKAQAISARSVAYYAIERDDEICDSQGCQVFSCAGEPSAIHRQAVDETSGIYLMNNATLTYGFYVAGDNNTAPPACVGVSGATEQWVTYNEGRTGTDVEQTDLGLVSDPVDALYGQNRGCMSQWGARCLENDNGYDSVDILRFYYGDDIELVQAVAECITPFDPPGGSGTSGSGSSTSGEPPGSTSGIDPSLGSDEASGIATAPTDTAPEQTGDEGGDTSEGPASDSNATTGPASGGTGSASGPGLPQGFGDTGGNGCGCQAPPTPAGPTWLWGGMLMLLWGRRRRRTAA